MRWSASWWLVVFILKTVHIHLYGMTPSFRRVEIGIASQNIRYIFQDHRGYMWFSGSRSVHRYDGNKVVEYKNVSDTKYATLLFEDKENVLWALTDFGAVMQYDRYLDRFIEKFSFVSIFDKRSAIISHVEDHDGYFWFATAGAGLIRLDPRSGKFKGFRFLEGDANSITSDGVAGVVVDKNNNVWVGTHRGVCLYDRNQDNFIRYNLGFLPTQEYYNYLRITSMCLHSNGQIYIGTFKGLHVFDPENLPDQRTSSQLLRGKSLIDKMITSVIEGQDGLLWVAAEGEGLSRLDPVQMKVENWKQDGTPFGICSDDIVAILSDRRGNIWTGSRLGDICVFDIRTKPIHYIAHSTLRQNNPSKEEIRCLYKESDSILWTGLAGKLNRINILTSHSREYLLHSQIGESLPVITKIVGDRGGDVLALSKEAIYRYDRKSGKFIVQNIYSGGGGKRGWFVTMTIDDQNLMWTASTWPAMSLNQFDGTLKTHMRFNDQELRRLGVRWVPRRMEFKFGRLILQNEINVFYLEQDRTFVKIDIHNNRSSLDTIQKKEEIIDFVPYARDKLIYLNDRNQIVLITHKEGKLVNKLILYDDGSDGRVQSLALDTKGLLWIVNSTGVSSIDVETGQQKVFDMFFEPFSKALILTDERNRIIVSFGNRILWFDPSEVRDTDLRVPLVFTDFLVNNKSAYIGKPSGNDGFSLSRHISTISQIDLSHRESTLSFEFGSMDFVYDNKIQYRYKMEGFDKEWIYSGARRLATYTNLDPGTYSFKIMARYLNGEWNNSSNSITVIIHPPFWRTWWFTAIEILTVTGLIWLFIRFRISRSLEIERLRSKIATDLHDEVGSSLTRISIYSDLLQNGITKAERVGYANSISNLSRSIISAMSDVVWSIDNQNDTLGDLILRMRGFATEVFGPKGIEFHFILEGLNEKKSLSPNLRQNLYLIFKESINNIIKHAKASIVTISLINSQRKFTLVIRDNGIGFHSEAQRKGNGLRNMHRRSDAIQATLRFLNSDGTTVILNRDFI